MLIFVSYAMKKHYEVKYKMKFVDNYVIMPCFNTEIQNDSFTSPKKYDNNLFVYAGGLSIWQCFNKTLKCYEEIEKFELPNTKLLILTQDKEKALEKIRKTNIKNYEIDFVKPENLPEILKIAKYGFVIRDDVPVNRVATPTKISTYIANGLIPIYSECIIDFHNKIKDYRFKLVYDNNFIDSLLSLANYKIDSKDVYLEYETIFKQYYNTNYYINEVSTLFSKITNK